MATIYKGNHLNQHELEKALHRIFITHFLLTGTTLSYGTSKNKSLCAAIHKETVVPLSNLRTQLTQNIDVSLVTLLSSTDWYTVVIHQSVGDKRRKEIIKELHISQLN